MLILLAGIGAAAEAPRPISDLRPTVILISIDGFRYDYWNKGGVPNLQHLIATGVRAKALLPCFPTVTFPNHYSIATGLYPAHHGIINNEIFDPTLQATFSYKDRAATGDARWWGGEPIWVTAEKQGQKTAPFFWPGATAPIEGIRPTYWELFNSSVTPAERVGKILSWLDLPAARRPTLLALYFEQVDHAGHDYGPDSPEVRQAISQVDSAIGMLLEGLRRRGIENRVNILVVSDHGMAAVSPRRTIFLDDYVDLHRVRVVSTNPLMLWPKQAADADEIFAGVSKMPHLKIYRSADFPERWRLTENPRVPPIIGVADEGWNLTTHQRAKSHKLPLGQHAFDNSLPAMWGIFVAHGPAFRAGATLPAFPNVDVYDLIAYLLRLEPAENDGSLDVFRPVLIRRSLVTPATARGR